MKISVKLNDFPVFSIVRFHEVFDVFLLDKNGTCSKKISHSDYSQEKRKAKKSRFRRMMESYLREHYVIYNLLHFTQQHACILTSQLNSQ